jgi:long-chain fatty acid transport protein
MQNPRHLSRLSLFVAVVSAFAAAPALHATNGMNLEGYGPVATAMGGTSMAFDNGTAAVINNPATLALQGEGARLDLAIGMLGPDITATAPNGVRADSQANAFFMPAVGYTRRSGSIVYGLGIFGQGGMGCEYEPNSWRGLGFGLENRTEVSVGRAILPVAWSVGDRLHFAGTLDFVWAGMDLKMAMTGAQFMDLISTHQIGQASGTIVQSFGQIMQQMPAGTSVDYAYFNFSNGNPFTGEAQGYGWAAKLGMVYEASDDITLGFTYHAKTHLSDLKAPGNSIAFQMNVPGMGAMPQTLAGDITVKNFEWPAMFGAGIAWHVNPKWLLTADVRQVFWSDVMKDFNLRFVASGATGNGPFAGQSLDATLYQDWDDQTAFMVGAAWKATDTFTVRFGGNYGSDPIPDRYLNCLFPATVEKHLTAGCGWQLSERSTLDLSITKGFEHSVVNGGGVTVKHSQLNAQVLYGIRF